MPDQQPITRALISVSDKTGIVEFAQQLTQLGVEILSTGGSAKTLAEAGVPVKYKCHEGMIHAFITMGKVIDETAVAIADVARHTKDAFDELVGR